MSRVVLSRSQKEAKEKRNGMVVHLERILDRSEVLLACSSRPNAFNQPFGGVKSEKGQDAPKKKRVLPGLVYLLDMRCS